MSDERNDPAGAPGPVPGSNPYPRRVLAGLFWLIACVAIMVASVTVWAHQTLLTSSGWSGIVADVAADPEVIESTSAVIVERLSERLELEARLETVLPGGLGIAAPILASGIEDRVAQGLADFAAREGVQEAFVNVNAAAHDAAIRAIRGGEGEVLTSEEGAIALNVFPLIEGALVGLQEVGLIDQAREIPDLSGYEPPAETVARLESLLGRDLPDDIGTITLVESERLGRAQDAVRAFDLITIGLVLLAVLCVALALWLSRRRLRMLIWLAIGAVVALALGRGFTRLVLEDITGSLRESPTADTVRGVVDASLDSLLLFTFAVIAAAIVVAGIALWLERRQRAPASRASTRGARVWIADNARAIAWVGLGVIALIVVWNVAGPDLALLAAAAAGVWLIAVSLLASRGEADGVKGADDLTGVDATDETSAVAEAPAEGGA